MGKIEDLIIELNELFKEGQKLQINRENKDDLAKLSLEYESWYTRAYAVIKQVIPERIQDFKEAYKLERRKEIRYNTYTISDYLINLAIKDYSGKPIFDIDNAYQMKILSQLSIIKSAIDSAPSKLHDIRAVLRAELFDDDITAAKELQKAGYLRSAGIICGVVLEKHLKSITERLSITPKRRVGISTLNDTLKDNGYYDVPTWRLIQRLADIRNLCGHPGDREPTTDEIQDLLSGTEKVIKEFS